MDHIVYYYSIGIDKANSIKQIQEINGKNILVNFREEHKDNSPIVQVVVA